MSGSATLAVDVGGTFTDAVVLTDRGLYTGKTPTTPDDQSVGVIEAARIALDSAGLGASDVTSFRHGMTVTTNAMLESRFARTALLATRGFTDVEQLGRQNRADLYRLCADRPSAIVPAELRFAVDERCGPDGVIEPLDESGVIAACKAAAAEAVEAVAICLLFAFRHPDHELRVAEIVRERMPGVHVSMSHAAVGTFREYERMATTIADAALAPLLRGYLDNLNQRCAEIGLIEPLVVQSNGGTVSSAIAAAHPALTVLSGPAGGAVGAANAAERIGERLAIGFDMGGTSTDVCRVNDGTVQVVEGHSIGGRSVALPSVDIGTVGAGGGSIAWRDDGGALRVGPQSAGARPGPACYGHGGTQPTVTDANLLLGYLGDESALAGGLRLDRGAAEAAVATLAESVGLSTEATAAGIVEIANLEMQGQVAAMTVARGIDPRDHALVAFGGAGPMHGAAIAAGLGIDRVVCPAACGVLSAAGMATAAARVDRSISLVRALDEVSVTEIDEIRARLSDELSAQLGLDPVATSTTATYLLRYSGQSFELAVAESSAGDRELAGRFHELHLERFGFADERATVELVTIQVSVSTPVDSPRGQSPTTTTPEEPSAVETKRRAWFDGVWHETTVVHADSLVDPLAGPAIVEQRESTVVVPPGWTANSRAGDIMLTREEAG